MTNTNTTEYKWGHRIGNARQNVGLFVQNRCKGAYAHAIILTTLLEEDVI